MHTQVQPHQDANHLVPALERQGDDGAVAPRARAQILRKIARNQVVAVAQGFTSLVTPRNTVLFASSSWDRLRTLGVV